MCVFVTSNANAMHYQLTNSNKISLYLLKKEKLNMMIYCVIYKVLECGVCEDVFSLQGDKVPRLLLCGHTVCHDCLTRLPLHGRAVRCPFDRQVTELGEFNIISL